jgi:hypothetical protein
MARTLKIALSALLFGVGLFHSGWHDRVLDHYGMNCTMLPDPAPYPEHLLKLAQGQFSIKGVRELLACESEPLYFLKPAPKPRIELGTGVR